jgi:hypothetical protein
MGKREYRERREGLKIIKELSMELTRVPAFHRRRSRRIRLILYEINRLAKKYEIDGLKKKGTKWINNELFRETGIFYMMVFNSFYYLSISLLSQNSHIYKNIRLYLEKLFELQDKTYSGYDAGLKGKIITIVYADMLGTVASASITSLYCAAKVLIYRQVFYFIMKKTYKGFVEVPIGDSLFAMFEDRKAALESSLHVLPYIIKNKLSVGIGITSGNDFLSSSKGRPIIGKDTNLAVRLAEKIRGISIRHVVRVKNIKDGLEYKLKKINIETAVWISETPIGAEMMKTVKTLPEINKIKFIEYIYDEKWSEDINKIWREIGYKNRKIIAIIPDKYVETII